MDERLEIALMNYRKPPLEQRLSVETLAFESGLDEAAVYRELVFESLQPRASVIKRWGVSHDCDQVLAQAQFASTTEAREWALKHFSTCDACGRYVNSDTLVLWHVFFLTNTESFSESHGHE